MFAALTRLWFMIVEGPAGLSYPKFALCLEHRWIANLGRCKDGKRDNLALVDGFVSSFALSQIAFMILYSPL